MVTAGAIRNMLMGYADSDEVTLHILVHRERGRVCGGSASVPVSFMFSGFDWDAGKILLQPERELQEVVKGKEVKENRRKGSV